MNSQKLTPIPLGILVGCIFFGIASYLTASLTENSVSEEQASDLPIVLAEAHHSENGLSFFENKGQINSKNHDIRYVVEAPGVICYLKPEGLVYSFVKIEKDSSLGTQGIFDDKPDKSTHATVSSVAMHWEGANNDVTIRAEEQAQEVRNYYTTGAPEGITNVRSYHKIIYENLYDQIVLVMYSQAGELKYDFVVKPGGDVDNIRLAYQGQDQVSLTQEGELVVSNSLGTITEGKPYTYQRVNGKEIEISSHYSVANGAARFEVADYDQTRNLIIDPTLLWATYYGGEEPDWGNAVCTDHLGNVYVAGTTFSYQHIAFDGHDMNYQTSSPVEEDAFLVKFDASGNRLWATYYGGYKAEAGNAVCTDHYGNVYLAGHTDSGSDIASGGHDNIFNENGADGNRFWRDAFLVKFNSNGIRQWGTYYGGEDQRSDVGTGVDTDNEGNVFLTGYTTSTTEIASNGYDNTFGGVADAFLVKFSSFGVRQWATYFGGVNDDRAHAICVDAWGSVYIAGETQSSSLGYQGHDMSYAEDTDAFLAKFSNDGDRYWSTYYGGNGYDIGTSVTTDASAFVYLAGKTSSSNYISTPAAHDPSYNGSTDAFLVKFNFLGMRQWGSYYGGNDREDDTRVCSSVNGEIYLAGTTTSETGIATNGSFKTEVEIYDAYLVRFNNVMKRQWGTYYGGSSNEYGHGVATEIAANGYLVGQT
ncbi:MAG: SBBP repeat-containing protein [Cyclobacteriaceae bacterium]